MGNNTTRENMRATIAAMLGGNAEAGDALIRGCAELLETGELAALAGAQLDMTRALQASENSGSGPATCARLDVLIALLNQRIGRLEAEAGEAQHTQERQAVRARALELLSATGPIGPAEIAAQLNIERPEISRALHQLHTDGKVVWKPDPHDKRSRIYTATGSGDTDNPITTAAVNLVAGLDGTYAKTWEQVAERLRNQEHPELVNSAYLAALVTATAELL